MKRQRKQARRQSITVEEHEWAAVLDDARAHGLTGGKFLLLVWRNWRSKRASLSLIPEIPVEPWERQKTA